MLNLNGLEVPAKALGNNTADVRFHEAGELAMARTSKPVAYTIGDQPFTFPEKTVLIFRMNKVAEASTVEDVAITLSGTVYNVMSSQGTNTSNIFLDARTGVFEKLVLNEKIRLISKALAFL